jgi:8-amino-7-oxononanoate synthase
LAKQHHAWLYIDDAHSIGVIGEKGQGSNSIADIDITMATFGKALATSGAFVTCSEQLHEYFINFSRHYIYSTAMSPAIAWATKKSIEIAQNEHWRREKIMALSELLSSTLKPSIQLVPTDSSIHAIILGDEVRALLVAEKLKKQGIWLTAIRPPTVAANTSRLRVTICASHNENDIKNLANNINKVLH